MDITFFIYNLIIYNVQFIFQFDYFTISFLPCRLVPLEGQKSNKSAQI